MSEDEQSSYKASKGIEERIAIFLASGFYSGFFPLAPGTVGTLVAIPLYFVISRFNSNATYIIITISLLLVGIIVSQKAARVFRQRDPSLIVVDEMVGFLVAMFLIEVTWWRLLGAFFIFRFLDIVKPFPVGAVEELGKGIGIMADDLVAGIYTNIIMHLAIKFL